MGTEITTSEKKPISLKGLFEREDMKKRFAEILGEKSAGFIASVLQLSAADNNLSKADPMSVMSSAMIAATLDLPINKNLGFSWIIPYGNQAQFQMGYKGFIQLALRTGQYERLNVVEVYENQFKSWNALTETLEADFSVEGTGKIVGYCAYFRLVNGFEKTAYWSKEKVTKHGVRFSKTFKSGPWQSDFDEMAKKTVLKNTLSRWGILSVQMITATQADQAVIIDNNGTPDFQYPDNEPEQKPNPEQERITEMINSAETVEALDKLKEQASDNFTDDQWNLFSEKKDELSRKKTK